MVSLLLSYAEGTVTMECIAHISLILHNGEHIGVTAFVPSGCTAYVVCCEVCGLEAGLLPQPL